MSKIFSLLVGVDEYFNPCNNLRGCVNDVNGVNKYLTLSFPKEDLRIKILTNQKASKRNIINAFDHYNEAKDGDQCIFYFSGHGSICKAPKILEDFVSDGLIKTIVCQDSRAPGKLDLMSFELAYLIWKVTHGKKIQFIVITDCCHSGEVTRDHKERNNNKSKTRLLEQGNSSFSIEDLHVEKHIFQVDILSPDFKLKRGQHIHFAACKNSQLAIECEIDGTRKGIFTHFLLETLKINNGIITYEDLYKKTRIKVERVLPNQTPQYYNVLETDHNQIFLSNVLDTGKPTGQVYFDKNEGWVINLGTLNSFIGKNSTNNPFIKIFNTGDTGQIEKIFTTHSILLKSDFITLDKAKIYDAQVDFTGTGKFAIGVNTLSQKQILSLSNEYNNTYSFYLTKTFEEYEVELLCPNNEDYYIKDYMNVATNYRPSFHFKKENIKYLFATLEKIGNWKSILNLEGFKNEKFENDLDIIIYKNIKPNSEIAQKITSNQNTTDIVILDNSNIINNSNSSGFQIQFRNKGNQTIWISVLYFSDDYSITNRLMNGHQLNSGQTSWVLQHNNLGNVLKNIKVKLSDDLNSKGLKSTIEYLKIIISTKEIDTSCFNQNAAINYDTLKSLVLPKHQLQMTEWVSKTVCLKIKRD